MAKTPICAVCAQNGPTCCHLTQGDGSLSFPLSRIEKQSITAYDRWKGVRFTVQTANSDQFISRLEFLFPNALERVQALFPTRSLKEQRTTLREESKRRQPLGKLVHLSPKGNVAISQYRKVGVIFHIHSSG